MISVLHIFHSLTVGGAARTAIATAKYSARLGPYRHKIAVLSLGVTDSRAIAFAMSQGMEVPIVRNRAELHAAMADSDIVQINWWQHPEMHEFLRAPMPPVRLLGWFHCAGQHAPQRVTEELVDIMDLAVAGSFYTYEAPGFCGIEPQEKLRRTAMVNGGADFERLQGFSAKPHNGINVSYIGTVDFTKMHRHFVRMSAAVKSADVRYIVCGGPKHAYLRAQAEGLGQAQRFDFRGYVEDIRSVLEITDIYGYPLAEDTYAASELNLQEAMYCGIPPVVFPHGGIKRLVENGVSGLVVNSEHEYAEAIDQLANDRELRARLGQGAAKVAREKFGAQRWAPEMNRCYTQLMQQPKQTRTWGSMRRSFVPPASLPHPGYRGAEIFLESLGGTHKEFLTSYASADLGELLEAEAVIHSSSELMRFAGIFPYRNYFPEDPFLALWACLAHLGGGEPEVAANKLAPLLESEWGPHHMRVLWYVSCAARAVSDSALEQKALSKLAELMPEFPFDLADSIRSSLFD